MKTIFKKRKLAIYIVLYILVLLVVYASGLYLGQHLIARQSRFPSADNARVRTERAREHERQR